MAAECVVAAFSRAHGCADRSRSQLVICLVNNVLEPCSARPWRPAKLRSARRGRFTVRGALYLKARGSMSWKKPPPFRTRRQVESYLNGKTIRCLLCGKRFRRLSFHLAAIHHISTDDYKCTFGLPWTRGLTCADSRRKSGWTAARRANASKQARKTRFFKLAHPSPRRDDAPFVRRERLAHLGVRGAGFGPTFERRVRALFEKGLTDGTIARKLKVNRMTVNLRTREWRARK